MPTVNAVKSSLNASDRTKSLTDEGSSTDTGVYPSPRLRSLKDSDLLGNQTWDPEFSWDDIGPSDSASQHGTFGPRRRNSGLRSINSFRASADRGGEFENQSLRNPSTRQSTYSSHQFSSLPSQHPASFTKLLPGPNGPVSSASSPGGHPGDSTHNKWPDNKDIGLKAAYIPPVDQKGASLKFDALLSGERTSVYGQSLSTSQLKEVETIFIGSSRGFNDDDGLDTVVLVKELKPSLTPSSHIRWIHLQHEHMSLKYLQDIIMRDSGLENEDIHLALQLLGKIQDNYEKEFIHGNLLEVSVLRCDGRTPKDAFQERHCTFLSFPYFSNQAAMAAPRKHTIRPHPSNGLLQTIYPFESTRTRDSQQVINKVRAKNAKKFIHVPQIWSIVFDSDTIITYSTHSLTSLRGNSIQISQPISMIRNRPSVIHVTDHEGRLYFFSVEQCKTWFELRERVSSHCLPDNYFLFDAFEIALKSGQILNATTWPKILATETAAFIEIVVQFPPVGTYNLGYQGHDSPRDEMNSQTQSYAPTIIQPSVTEVPQLKPNTQHLVDGSVAARYGINPVPQATESSRSFENVSHAAQYTHDGASHLNYQLQFDGHHGVSYGSTPIPTSSYRRRPIGENTIQNGPHPESQLSYESASQTSMQAPTGKLTPYNPRSYLGSLSGKSSYLGTDLEPRSLISQLSTTTTVEQLEQALRRQLIARRQAEDWVKPKPRDQVVRKKKKTKKTKRTKLARSMGVGSEESPPSISGKTSFPARLVSVKAIRRLGYSYEEYDDRVVIQTALSQQKIDEVLQHSDDFWTAQTSDTSSVELNASDEAFSIRDPDQTDLLTMKRTRIRKLREDYKSSEESPIQSLSQGEVVVVKDHDHSEFPKSGKTKMPASRASMKIISDLGFGYEQEGDTIIIHKALGPEQIEEILQLSEDFWHENPSEIPPFESNSSADEVVVIEEHAPKTINLYSTEIMEHVPSRTNARVTGFHIPPKEKQDNDTVTSQLVEHGTSQNIKDEEILLGTKEVTENDFNDARDTLENSHELQSEQEIAVDMNSDHDDNAKPSSFRSKENSKDIAFLSPANKPDSTDSHSVYTEESNVPTKVSTSDIIDDQKDSPISINPVRSQPSKPGASYEQHTRLRIDDVARSTVSIDKSPDSSFTESKLSENEIKLTRAKSSQRTPQQYPLSTLSRVSRTYDRIPMGTIVNHVESYMYEFSTNDDVYYDPDTEDELKQDVPKVMLDGGTTSGRPQQYHVNLSEVEGENMPYPHATTPIDNVESSLPTDLASLGSIRESKSSSLSATNQTALAFLPILMWPTRLSIRKRDTELLNKDDVFSKVGTGLKASMEGSLIQSESQSVEGSVAEPIHMTFQSLGEVLNRIDERLNKDAEKDHAVIYRNIEAGQLQDAKVIPAENVLGNTIQTSGPVLQIPDVHLKEKSTPALSRQPLLKDVYSRYSSQKLVTAMNAECKELLVQFTTRANRLLEAFAPPGYSNIVVGKYYGAIRLIIKIFNNSQQCYSLGQNALALNENAGGILWMTRELDTNILKTNDVPVMHTDIIDCKQCSANKIYETQRAIQEHLRTVHFDQKADSKFPSQLVLSGWTKQLDPLRDEERLKEQMRVLAACHSHLTTLETEIQQIHEGVSTHDKSQRFALPRAFVLGFQNLLLLLIYTTHVLQYIDKKRIESIGSWHWNPASDDELLDASVHLERLGYDTQEALIRGKIDLKTMIATRDFAKSVTYEAVGPQYILAMLLGNLQSGFDNEVRDLLKVYKEYTDRLAFQVSQRPRRRLLREFFSLSEEIGAIFSTLEKQERIIQDFRCVLAPSSLRITSHTRHSQYALETRLLHKSTTLIKKKKAQYMELKQQVDRQINLTKMGIEILDDDHGTAILVFTVVTLVFLPLSFVTSYLGMNTADIRNQDATQGLFWEIATPLTSAVIAIALVVGYKFEAMREWARRYGL